MLRILLLGATALLVNGAALAGDIKAKFELDVAADKSLAAARIIVQHKDGALREIVLDSRRLQNIGGDGDIRAENDRIRWTPPTGGGTLRYRVALRHEREGKNSTGYDAWVGPKFAIFRGEKAFPIRSSRRLKGSTFSGDLSIVVPAKWSLITPYLPDGLGRLPIYNPGKRLARPMGWITAGDLGTRRDFIKDLEITVTAPRGLRMERVAMLGLLRWTLPELVPAISGPTGKRYINIVAAADPMWLGALSAPNSIFVHADRPLISENGTSTIVHEMVHVLLADLDTPRDEDWIDEGLAEFLALRALRDSGTISPARYDSTIAGFRRWGAAARNLRTSSSTGPVTARAVAVFHDLDAELRQASKGQQSVATLVKRLLRSKRRVDVTVLRSETRAILGKPSRALAREALPGLDVGD